MRSVRTRRRTQPWLPGIPKIEVLREDREFGKVCLFKTEAGKNLHKPQLYHANIYDVCLSPTQVKTLFPNGIPRKPLGAGATAKVWVHDKNTIVKITRDPDDVAALLSSQGLSHVVKVHKAYELDNAGRTKKGNPIRVWAIIAEKLQPTTPKYNVWIERGFERVRPMLVNYANQYIKSVGDDRGLLRGFKVPQKFKNVIPTICENIPQTDADNRSCQRFVTELGDTFESLVKRGIVWNDIHSGNIALSRGTWKAIDLGFSDAPFETRVPMLQGLRRFKRFRPLRRR